jgi:hypothetical protein
MPAFAGHTTGRADFRHSAFRLASPQGPRGSAALGWCRATTPRQPVFALRYELPLTGPDRSRCLQADRQSPSPLTVFESMPKVRALCSAGITQPRRSYDPVRLPSWPLPSATLRPLPPPMTGLPQLPEPPFRRAVPTTPADRAGARVDCFPRSLEPSPNGRRVGIRIVTFEACAGFTHVTARRIAQPPKVTFVARLRPSQLPDQAARQLPDSIDNYPGGTLLH